MQFDFKSNLAFIMLMKRFSFMTIRKKQILLSFVSPPPVFQLCNMPLESSSVTKLQSLKCSMFKTTVFCNPPIHAIAVTLEKAMFDLTLVSCPSILYMTHCLSFCISLAGSWHLKETKETLLGCQSLTSLGRLFVYPGNHKSHNFRYIVFSGTSKEILYETSFDLVLNMEKYGNAMEVLSV